MGTSQLPLLFCALGLFVHYDAKSVGFESTSSCTPTLVALPWNGLTRLRGGEMEQSRESHMITLGQDNGEGKGGKSKKNLPSSESRVSALKKALQAKLSKGSAQAAQRSSKPSDGHSESVERAESQANRKKTRPGSFAALGLSEEIIKGMYHAGYKFPTPIQRRLIPHVISGSHVVAMARTGSGKTAAFLAPIIHRLTAFAATKRDARKLRGLAGLVLLPTRELALQSFQFFKTYAKFTSLTACLVSGGEPIESQFAAIATNPDLLFATPGRLLQILDEVPSLSLRELRVCVLDEADRLFEGSLSPVVHEVLSRMKKPHTIVSSGRKKQEEERQMVLVSATLPQQLSEFTKTDIGEDQCVFVRLDTERFLSPTLRVAFVFVLPATKLAGLLFLLKDVVTAPADANQDVREDPFAVITDRGLVDGSEVLARDASRTPREERKRCLIFCATKYTVEFLETVLNHAGVLAVGVHGRMDQDQRNTALASFKRRDVEALVVTDLAARGLDIPLLDYVINYDVAATPKLFVHRAGRAGRAGAVGTVFTLVAPMELAHTLDTALFLGRKIETQPQGEPQPGQSLLDAPDNFLMGTLPMHHLTFWNEFSYHVFERDGSLEGLAESARRGHTLYARTCPRPSKSSVEAAKEILDKRTGTQKVHLWFHEFANRSGDTELEEQMDEAKKIVLNWAPKGKQDLAMEWQQDLWEIAKPLRELAKMHKAEVEEEENPTLEFEDPDVKKELDALPMPDSDSEHQRKPMSLRSQLRAQQTFFGGDSEISEGEEIRRQGLRVKSGGSMGAGDRVKENMLHIAPDDAKGMAEATRQRPRRVWDKKKCKYVFPDQLNPQQARELKIIKNEAGERFRLNGKKKAASVDDDDDDKQARGGDLYRKWAAKAKVRVQKVGEYENQKLVKKAADRAVVPIRNKLAGETRFGASIVAGAKRSSPAVTKLEAQKGSAPTTEQKEHLTQLRTRRLRAESQRKKIKMRKTGGVGELPRKLRVAMEHRAQAMTRNAKGLRVGAGVGLDTALSVHKKMMKLGSPPKKKQGRHSARKGAKPK